MTDQAKTDFSTITYRTRMQRLPPTADEALKEVIFKQIGDHFKSYTDLVENYNFELFGRTSEGKLIVRVTTKYRTPAGQDHIDLTVNRIWLKDLIDYIFEDRLPKSFHIDEIEGFKSFMLKHFPNIGFNISNLPENKGKRVRLIFNREGNGSAKDSPVYFLTDNVEAMDAGGQVQYDDKQAEYFFFNEVSDKPVEPKLINDHLDLRLSEIYTIEPK